MHDFALTIALVGVLGIGAQWLAWKTATPAIAATACRSLLQQRPFCGNEGFGAWPLIGLDE